MPSHLLRPSDLLSLEDYHRQRPEFRRRLIDEKKRRRLDVGEHACLFFENRTTMHYQVQEMLLAEKIFASDAIADELAAYNPLIPDGNNFKATMMLQYIDAHERRAALARLVGIETRVWLMVAGFDRLYATPDPAAARDNAAKTSAVHFLCFALDSGHCDALKGGASLSVGIDHAHYTHTVASVSQTLLGALLEDLA